MQNKKQHFSSYDKACLLALPSHQAITRMSLDDAMKEADIHHAAYWPYWIARGYVDSKVLSQVMADTLGMPIVATCPHALSTLATMNQGYIAWLKAEPGCFVVQDNNHCLTVLMGTPIDPDVIAKWSLQCDRNIKVATIDYAIVEKVVTYTLFLHARAHCLRDDHGQDDVVSQCCHALLLDAITCGATDIHGEPGNDHFQVRFRIEGILEKYCTFPIALSRKITNRLKVMSQRDLSVTRLPQDGHLTIIGHLRGVRDARINFCPLIHGEKWVIRLLNTQQKTPHIHNLDLNKRDKERLLHAIDQPQGLVLITGPTGSGKTTTLYALIETLNTPGVNISTIEDPVEQQLTNINQIEVKPAADLNFSVGLRALLRQDPDIMMIGEIRDKETAAIALNAAQTGHLVFATLHSNSTSHTIARLLSMGFHPEQLSHTLLCIVAQRLVRLRCRRCDDGDSTQCNDCRQGYDRRTAIYEIMMIDAPLRRTIEHIPFDREALESLACQQGMTTLSEAGQALIDQELTDAKEIERVLCH